MGDERACHTGESPPHVFAGKAMVVTLVEFLQQRLDDDEAAARADDFPGSESEFWAGHELSVVAAHRRIVELHWGETGGRGDIPYECHLCMDACGWPCDTLRALASVYADHPDYLSDWSV